VIRPIFSESMIIFGKLMSRKETLGGLRYMKDVIKVEITIRGMI
jgi:hypothetical protein